MAAGQPESALFAPSHTVPEGGLAAYDSPDPSRPAVAQLDPRLPVQVTEELGAWSHVVCSNGWNAWVDGRLLVQTPASTAVAPPAAPPVSLPAATVATPPAGSPPVSSPTSAQVSPGRLGDLKRMPRATLSPVALAGAALVLLGSLLPWWSFAGFGTSAWRIPVGVLFSGKGDPGGIKTGILLLVVVLVVLPLLMRRPMSGWLNAVLGAVASNLALVGAITAFRYTPHLQVGAGLALCFLGGAVLVVERVVYLQKATSR